MDRTTETIPSTRSAAARGDAARTHMLAGLVVASAFLAGACAGGPAHRGGVATVQSGVIESVAQIAPVRVSALTGMLVGGALGNSGCGPANRQVGLALGALGGAWAVGSATHAPVESSYRAVVRLDDGSAGYFDSRDPVSIHVGERVLLSGHRVFEPSVVADTGAPGRDRSALRLR